MESAINGFFPCWRFSFANQPNVLKNRPFGRKVVSRGVLGRSWVDLGSFWEGLGGSFGSLGGVKTSEVEMCEIE